MPTIANVPSFYHLQKREINTFLANYPQERWIDEYHGDYPCEIITSYQLDYSEYNAATYPIIGIAKIQKPTFANETGLLVPAIVGNYALFAYRHYLANDNNFADYDLEKSGVVFISEDTTWLWCQKNKYTDKAFQAKQALNKSSYGKDSDYWNKFYHYHEMDRLKSFYTYALDYAEKSDYIRKPKNRLED